ncbi:hypothetical protein FGRA07_04261 [Fusarium graminearum]|nr:hypothetical protein FGRA07_04261 [Fusarium graminearum]
MAKQHECPTCPKAFQLKKDLKRHISCVHEKRQPFKCPHCPKSFGTKGNMAKHIQIIHEQRKPFKCSHCLKTFSDQSNLTQHIRSVHGKLRPFNCPQCGVSFSKKWHLNRHWLKLHAYEGLPRPFPCPDCEKGYVCKSDVDLHWEIHHAEKPLRFLCNICKKPFTSKPNMERHELQHTHIKCPLHSCYTFFKTAEEALTHAEDPDHRSDMALYLCPIPKCKRAVAGRLLRACRLPSHWQYHVDNGHVSSSDVPDFKRAEIPRFYRNPLFEAIFKHQRPANIDTISSADSDFNMKDPDDITDQMEIDGDEDEYEGEEISDDIDHMEIDGDKDDYEEEDDYEKEEDEDDYEEEVDYHDLGDMSPVDYYSGRGNRLEVSTLKSNENMWNALKNEVSVVLDARGYTCIGPGLNLRRDLVQEPCPEQLTMRLNSKPPKIDFGPLREKFLGVVAKPWTLWRIEYEDQAKLSLSQVKHTMQLETQKQPIPRKVVILDCEYGFGLKLLEFSIVDRETNEVLINTLIRQTDVEADLRLKQFPPSVQNADKLREEKIFANANTLTLMDVNQVAKALRRVGITPETVFLVWAVTNFDLTIVREFLERGGHTGILPNDDN